MTCFTSQTIKHVHSQIPTYNTTEANQLGKKTQYYPNRLPMMWGRGREGRQEPVSANTIKSKCSLLLFNLDFNFQGSIFRSPLHYPFAHLTEIFPSHSKEGLRVINHLLFSIVRIFSGKYFSLHLVVDSETARQEIRLSITYFVLNMKSLSSLLSFSGVKETDNTTNKYNATRKKKREKGLGARVLQTGIGATWQALNKAKNSTTKQ